MRWNKLAIDLSVIRNNYKYIRSITSAEIGAAVKSDCYGLGVEKCSQIFLEEGCRTFFVATVDEGITLRKFVGGDLKIYVLHGVVASEEADFAEYNLTPVINNEYQLDIWSQFALKKQKKLECAIHVDTGINRLGMHISEFDKIFEKIFSSFLDINLVISHLAYGSDINQQYNKIQREKFEHIRSKISKAHNTRFSLSNSAGIMISKDYHYDLVRPGAALYGIHSTNPPSTENIKFPLKYTSKIIHINTLSDNEFVGYNCTYQTNRELYNDQKQSENDKKVKIATIPIGYAEKLPRYLSNSGYCVKICGYKVPVVGIISMNLITVEATNIPDSILYIGQEVIVVDHELIQKISGSQYEFLTNFYEFKHRQYISN